MKDHPPSHKYTKLSRGDAWVLYTRVVDPPLAINDHVKFHIPIEHDLTQITAALPIVEGILRKYGIEHYKHVELTTIEKYRGCNTDGKALVIYMQTHLKGHQEASPLFWANVINEIENALIVAQIRHHPLGSLGDNKISGSKGFTSSRCPYNVVGEYIPADDLALCCFTQNEASHISDNSFIREVSKLLISSSLAGIAEDEKPPELKMEAVSQSGKWDGLRNNFDPEKLDDEIYKNLLSNKIGELAIICYGRKSWQPFCQSYTGEAMLFMARTRPLLQEAAKRVAKIYDLTGIKSDPDNILGSPAPAIYYHFFKPCIEYMRAHKTSFEEAMNFLDPDKIVDAIIECYLRDPKKKQIRSTQPIYINGLSSKEVSDYIKKTKGFSPKSSEGKEEALETESVSRSDETKTKVLEETSVSNTATLFLPQSEVNRRIYELLAHAEKQKKEKKEDPNLTQCYEKFIERVSLELTKKYPNHSTLYNLEEIWNKIISFQELINSTTQEHCPFTDIHAMTHAIDTENITTLKAIFVNYYDYLVSKLPPQNEICRDLLAKNKSRRDQYELEIKRPTLK